MMKPLFIGFFCFLVGLSAIYADVEIPYPANCSTRVLCSEHRLRLPDWDESYKAEFWYARGVVNNRFRIIIQEPDFHRYLLLQALEDDPTPKRINIDTEDEQYLIASDNEGNRIVIVYGTLDIYFFHDDMHQVTFQGNKLIMENTEESQAFTFNVNFVGAKRFVGLPERPNNVTLMHTKDYKVDPYRLKNLDYGTFGYKVNVTQAMYGSIPVLYAVGDRTSGLFINNAAEMWVDIDNNQKSAYFMVDGGVLDVFIMLGPSLVDTVRQYTDLTGKAHLPQLWALGYHQSRWAYNSTEDVKNIISKFDENNFPLDALWLDIEYTDGRKWFTWNSTSFPDPVELLDWVDAQGHRKIVPISDPNVKIDPDYEVYAHLLKNDLLVRNANGTVFVAKCWPGDSGWVDFFNPEAREYYASRHLYENFPSTPAIGGFWNDMNEPSTFDRIHELTISYESVHYGPVKHRDVHNIYGMLQVMSTHQGLMNRDKGKLRPFLLSRSFFAGSQRYTAKWNGDTDCIFEHLRILVPMTISSNLAGLVFYGSDVPGFEGNPTDELAIRWYQTGAWIPFFRAHANLSTIRREPFTFATGTQNLLREAISTRYKHLPYWYTLFYEHSITGDPIVRPLFYHYPSDDVALDINDQFLVGANVLVANVYYSEATNLAVYLPGEEDFWYQVTGNISNVYQGGQWYDIPVDISFTPVFYKSGSIITRKPRVNRTTADIKDDPYELHIVLDQDGKAETRIYIDDFESFEYLNNGKYLYVRVIYDQSTKSVNVTSINDDDTFSLDIESLFVYSNNGDGSYNVTEVKETRDGTPLVDVSVLDKLTLL